MIVCRMAERSSRRCGRRGRLVGEVLTAMSATVAPGVTTGELDALAEQLIRGCGGDSSLRGYHGYPATICASVNDEVIHGIPSADARAESTATSSRSMLVRRCKGYFGDSAVTLPVAPGVGRGLASLLRVRTKSRCSRRLRLSSLAARVSDIGHAGAGSTSRRSAISVVRDFVGHGHRMSGCDEAPGCRTHGEVGRGRRLAEGMVLAIEPMVNAGEPCGEGVGRRVDRGHP